MMLHLALYLLLLVLQRFKARMIKQLVQIRMMLFSLYVFLPASELQQFQSTRVLLLLQVLKS